jgi:glycerol-3-phosphate dehydrogenase
MLVFVCPSSAIRGLAEATLPLLRGTPVGVRNTRSVRDLARSVGVEMQITEQMYLLLLRGQAAAAGRRRPDGPRSQTRTD